MFPFCQPDDVLAQAGTSHREGFLANPTAGSQSIFLAYRQDEGYCFHVLSSLLPLVLPSYCPGTDWGSPGTDLPIITLWHHTLASHFGNRSRETQRVTERVRQRDPSTAVAILPARVLGNKNRTDPASQGAPIQLRSTEQGILVGCPTRLETLGFG